MVPAAPAVVVPVPPLAMPNVPVTSLEPKAMAPMLSSPDIDLTTPVPKELMVVEPFGFMVNKDTPVWEATTKGLTEP